jgi:hypothetical protein
MRRTGQACRLRIALLRLAGHPRASFVGIVEIVSVAPRRGVAHLAACPFQVLIRRHVLLAEFSRAQLAGRRRTKPAGMTCKRGSNPLSSTFSQLNGVL